MNCDINPETENRREMKESKELKEQTLNSSAGMTSEYAGLDVF